MRRASRVLIVESDPPTLHATVDLLTVAFPTLEIIGAPTGEAALDRIREGPLDLLIADLHAKGRDGRDLLSSVEELAPGTPTVLTARAQNAGALLDAVEMGRAQGSLVTPIDPTRLVSAVHDALIARHARDARDDARAHAIGQRHA